MKTKNHQSLSPDRYRRGWQIAQAENELLDQMNNRLKTIRAINRLKRGELFLEEIEG